MTGLRLEADEEVNAKEIELREVTGQAATIQTQLRTTLELLETTMSEKTSLEHGAAVAFSGIAELKARAKYISTELDVLRVELGTKDKALEKERHALNTATTAAQRSTNDISRNIIAHDQVQLILEKHRREIEYTSSAIRKVQALMDMERRQLSSSIESRNATGARLADIDNEFTVLCEKSNLIQEAQERAERQLQALSDETRILKVTCADLKRQQLGASRLIPKGADTIDKRLAGLREDYAAVCAEAEALMIVLTDPQQVKMRKLDGADLELQELEGLASALELRASSARERLLWQSARRDENRARRIVLEKMADGDDDTNSASVSTRKFNEIGTRCRNTTRKLMSAVAELSLHEATAAKLEQEGAELADELAAAEVRVANGLPPTEVATQLTQTLVRLSMVAPFSLNTPVAEAPARVGLYVQEGVIVGGAGTLQGIPRPTPFPPARGGAVGPKK